jgi:hypothetical protein
LLDLSINKNLLGKEEHEYMFLPHGGVLTIDWKARKVHLYSIPFEHLHCHYNPSTRTYKHRKNVEAIPVLQ